MAIGFVIGRQSVQQQITEREKIVRVVTVIHEQATTPTLATQGATVNVDSKIVPDEWNENRWRELDSQLGTASRNEMLAAMLEKLAVSDPQRAMALAEAETNLKLRGDLVQAVLRGWATVAPMDAANWALALTNENERNQSIATIFSSAVRTDPQSAVSVASQICRENPEQAVFYGLSLIQSLCQAGQFELATQFAADTDNPSRPAWLVEAYSDWAKFQPSQAAQAAQAMTDSEMRSQALRGLASGWSDVDPAGLAQFLTQLPAGESRGEMLGWALQNWANADPVAATAWVNNNYQKVGADMDSGFQSIATANALQPNVAVVWAEAITDPARRSDALTVILQTWIHSDPAIAEQYFSKTQNLLPADRERISAIIASSDAPSPQ